MSHLSDAQDRLERAFARLEEASVGRAMSDAPGDSAIVGELDELRTRYAGLQDRTRTVSDRLDSAISRMKSVLDG